MDPIQNNKAGVSKNKTEKKPSVSAMVDEALETLKNRKGVSLKAIKVYIATTYLHDQTSMNRLSSRINKILKEQLEKEVIVSTTGNLNGRFKLNVEPKLKTKETKVDTDDANVKAKPKAKESKSKTKEAIVKAKPKAKEPKRNTKEAIVKAKPKAKEPKSKTKEVIIKAKKGHKSAAVVVETKARRKSRKIEVNVKARAKKLRSGKTAEAVNLNNANKTFNIITEVAN